MTKGIAFLTLVEDVDAKLVAVALAQAAVAVELADRIAFDLDGVEFRMMKGKQVVAFRLVDVPPEAAVS